MPFASSQTMTKKRTQKKRNKQATRKQPQRVNYYTKQV